MNEEQRESLMNDMQSLSDCVEAFIGTLYDDEMNDLSMIYRYVGFTVEKLIAEAAKNEIGQQQSQVLIKVFSSCFATTLAEQAERSNQQPAMLTFRADYASAMRKVMADYMDDARKFESPSSSTTDADPGDAECTHCEAFEIPSHKQAEAEAAYEQMRAGEISLADMLKKLRRLSVNQPTAH